MEFIADLHIHSKYSRATSPQMNVESLAKWAKIKGIHLIGTGDFTHYLWVKELKEKLEPAGNGLYVYDGVHFMLTAEISSIYSKNGRCYRIHNVIFAPSIEVVEKINKVLGSIGNIVSDGRPILGLDAAKLARIIFDIDENCVIVPAHIWTPWFSLFGSMSGFDRIEDCFEEQTEKIFCLETGLSSDPIMNWRLSALDRFSLLSNSDSHSPQKIGRESNVFDCDLSYYEIRDALKTKDKKRFLYTIEFFPEEGKYHYDGHRNCGIRCSPSETSKFNGICPECGKKLTVGVTNRVDVLADREVGFKPKSAIPYKNLIPLIEIIAEARGFGVQSKAVNKEYTEAIEHFGTEFEILMRASEADLKKGLTERTAEGVIRVRKGNVNIAPGFDGEYGKIKLFSNAENVLKSTKKMQSN